MPICCGFPPAVASLCYQLPALLLPGVTVVVSPLIALMKDQIDALAARGIAAGRLDSTLGTDEYRALMAALRDGGLRLLYVAPERFNNERFRAAIARVRVFTSPPFFSTICALASTRRASSTQQSEYSKPRTISGLRTDSEPKRKPVEPGRLVRLPR